MQLLDRNPCAPVQPPKTVKRDPNPLDEANLTKLAAALSSLDESGCRQLADAIRLALFTGMRQGELCGLRWEDVDGALTGEMAVGGRMHVNNTVEIIEGGCELTERPKNGVLRDVPINTDVLAVLERRRNEVAAMWGEEIGEYYVLSRPETPLKWCNPGTLQKYWRAFRAVAGIHGLTDRAVATGCDEGGCMPSLSTGTTAATALLADAVSIPVLAAGGIVNERMAMAAKVVGAEGVFVGTRFILSEECRAAAATKRDIMATHPDDFIVFTQAHGASKWRTTPHKHGVEGLAANRAGDMNPPSGSFFYGMLQGDPDAGVNTVSDLASLIKSIDPCETIVRELGAPFAE